MAHGSTSILSGTITSHETWGWKRQQSLLGAGRISIITDRKHTIPTLATSMEDEENDGPIPLAQEGVLRGC